MESSFVIILIFILLICIAVILWVETTVYTFRRYFMGGNDDIYSLEPISKFNISKVKNLKIKHDQTKYIANINDSLIQASFLKDWHGFVFKSKNKIIGFGSYAKYEKISNSYKIYKFMIDEKYQGKGYGSIFLDLLILKIPTKNIYLDVHSKNTIAIKLYSKKFKVISDDGTNTIMKLS